MNIYFVDAGFHRVVVDRVDIYDVWGDEGVAGFVVANTRGQARSLFIAHDGFTWSRVYLEWTDKISIRLCVKDVDFAPGLITPDWDALESAGKQIMYYGYGVEAETIHA